MRVLLRRPAACTGRQHVAQCCRSPIPASAAQPSHPDQPCRPPASAPPAGPTCSPSCCCTWRACWATRTGGGSRGRPPGTMAAQQRGAGVAVRGPPSRLPPGVASVMSCGPRWVLLHHSTSHALTAGPQQAEPDAHLRALVCGHCSGAAPPGAGGGADLPAIGGGAPGGQCCSCGWI